MARCRAPERLTSTTGLPSRFATPALQSNDFFRPFHHYNFLGLLAPFRGDVLTDEMSDTEGHRTVKEMRQELLRDDDPNRH